MYYLKIYNNVLVICGPSLAVVKISPYSSLISLTLYYLLWQKRALFCQWYLKFCVFFILQLQYCPNTCQLKVGLFAFFFVFVFFAYLWKVQVGKGKIKPLMQLFFLKKVISDIWFCSSKILVTVKHVDALFLCLALLRPFSSFQWLDNILEV